MNKEQLKAIGLIQLQFQQWANDFIAIECFNAFLDSHDPTENAEFYELCNTAGVDPTNLPISWNVDTYMTLPK